MICSACVPSAPCDKLNLGKSSAAAQQTEAQREGHQAELIDGKAVAQTIRKECAAEVDKLREKYGKVLIFCLRY